ncbi:class I SAM-dependent methyltransferase [Salinigranum halophilum]|uniref:class I SAM-dependent methyltransferase n=1 Tax=Salinigranum halophilum TaxID=2565931 RepID=UPI0010A806CC|nr:class I SAM-dependent methyltransferase [Salinigranum halophilum]
MDRNDWEKRYESGDYTPRTYPSKLLASYTDWAPGGRAIEVAAGTGRNALYLAEQGYDVDAIELSASAVEQGTQNAAERSIDINWIRADVADHDFPAEAYTLAVVCFFHDPGLVSRLIDALEPGGVLVYEHHVRTAEDVERGPSDDHRYRPNELLGAANELTVLFYREAVRTFESGDRAGTKGAIASLVAQKPDRAVQGHPPEP